MFGALRRDLRIVGFSALCAGASSFGQTFFIAVFYAAVTTAADLTYSTLGATYAAATMMSTIGVLWLGKAIDQVDLRIYFSIVMTGLALGAFAFASATGVVMLAVAMFLLRLFGQGLVWHSGATSVARYLEGARGRGSSIMILGIATGQVVLPISAVWLAVGDGNGWITQLEWVNPEHGWRLTWILIGSLVLLVAFPAGLFLLKGHTQRHASWLRAMETHSSQMPSSMGLLAKKVYSTPAFLMMLPAWIAPPFLVTGLLLFQVPFSQANGWTASEFVVSFAMFSGANVASALFGGVVVDRFGAQRVCALSPLALGLSFACLAVGGSIVMLQVAMLLLGVSVGMFASGGVAYLVELFGARQAGTVRTVTFPLGIVSTAAAPIIYGVLLEAGTTTEQIAVASALYCGAALVIAWLSVVWFRTTPELRPNA